MRIRSSFVATVLALAALAATSAVPVQAAVPTSASVEGLLLSAGGGPAADGNYSMTFAIYAAETGGNAVWTEAGVAVAAKGGQFNTQIGAKTPLSAAVVNLQTAWLGVQVGTDPELPRKPLSANLFALRAAVAEGLECSGCLKAGVLDASVLQPYAKTTDLSAYAKSADLGAYAKSSDLGAYAKTADLGAYAKSTDLGAYAKSTDLANYVQASALAKVAGTGDYADLKNAPSLAKVATTGDYADLKNAPAIPQTNKLCGTGLFLKGYNADGSINCAPIVAGDLPLDGIKSVTNGLLTDQFVDLQNGTPDVQIKDGLGAGVTDVLSFPDIGQAQKIWINMSIQNSDLSGVRVELYGPSIVNPYILYDGGKTGTTLTAAFNDSTAIVSGNINGDWLGKNIKGQWSVTVKDLKAGGGSGGFDGKFNWSIAIQTLSNKKLQLKGDLIVDGNIVMSASNALAQRVQGRSTKLSGYADYADSWRTMPGLVVPFTATGGPVQIATSWPMYAGSHHSCRALVDGLPGGLYAGFETTYKWADGLSYTWQPGSGIWRMWDATHVLKGIAPGNHVASFECLNDSTQGSPQIGRGGSVNIATVIPYDDPANAEVKVYSASALPSQTIGSTNVFATISGLSVPFVSQGGPVRVTLAIPSSGGSHSSCRPLIDGAPAGAGDIDDTSYTWQEGLNYVAGWWNMWTRTRVYKPVAAGNHTLTVQCLTDSAPTSIGNSRMGAQAIVTSYLPNTDPNSVTKVYWGSEKKSYTISSGSSWTALSSSGSGTGINIKFTATGGPVEIGASIPLNGGSHTTCRAIIDGKAAQSGEPDSTSDYWQEGLVYTAGSWQMWNRSRVYTTLAKGEHTLWYECHGDSGGVSAGHSNMVSHVYAIAY
ncbi:MAG: hypothetical protein HY902_16440 [Deltaproteobacteria bacterium]|nr:hypothetical protein [Deltaproteobacteria bacterium]